MISGEQAASIAAETAKPLGLGTGVDKVLELPEIDRLHVIWARLRKLLGGLHRAH